MLWGKYFWVVENYTLGKEIEILKSICVSIYCLFYKKIYLCSSRDQISWLRYPFLIEAVPVTKAEKVNLSIYLSIYEKVFWFYKNQDFLATSKSLMKGQIEKFGKTQSAPLGPPNHLIFKNQQNLNMRNRNQKDNETKLNPRTIWETMNT